MSENPIKEGDLVLISSKIYNRHPYDPEQVFEVSLIDRHGDAKLKDYPEPFVWWCRNFLRLATPVDVARWKLKLDKKS